MFGFGVGGFALWLLISVFVRLQWFSGSVVFGFVGLRCCLRFGLALGIDCRVLF